MPEDGVVLGLLLYADKSKLSSFSTEMGYPVEARILNLPIDTRTKQGSDGTFVMLKGLPVGNHTIYASGLLVDFTTSSNLNFVSEVKYDINVTPAK